MRSQDALKMREGALKTAGTHSSPLRPEAGAVLFTTLSLMWSDRTRDVCSSIDPLYVCQSVLLPGVRYSQLIVVFPGGSGTGTGTGAAIGPPSSSSTIIVSSSSTITGVIYSTSNCLALRVQHAPHTRRAAGLLVSKST